jgi:lysozyme
MKIGSDGIELIQHFESCKLKAYWDKHGAVWTIGWGSTGPDIVEGLVWTQEQADDALRAHLTKDEDAMNAALGDVTVAQNEFDALMSFLYNVGPGGRNKDGLFRLRSGNPSTLWRCVLAGDRAGAAAQFGRWNRAGGVVLPGLTRRRDAEAALYLGRNWRQYL